MRAFLSINLTDPIHQAITKLQSQLNHEVKNIRWTKPQNCHLTLKFFGDVEESFVEELSHQLAPVANESYPFEIELGGIGQFPPRGPLSVLWVGVLTNTDPLMELEKAIRTKLIESKVKFDKKPFSPHLTIGRGKRTYSLSPKTYNHYRQFSLGILPVDSFHLMESRLDPQGAIYNERIRFRLGEKNV